MIRFALNPSESARKKLEQLRKDGFTYAYSELLMPQSIEKDEAGLYKKFKHEQEVLEMFQVIDGSREDDELFGFLDYDKLKEGRMCQHMVCVLPYCASCDALEQMLIDHREEFKNLNLYEIINISGWNSKAFYRKPADIKQKIKECEEQGKKTLTLTVNRMLTGSTVKQWDTMLYMKDTSSPQEYDQAIFRLQSQNTREYIDTDGKTIKINIKPQTLLVDFDPNRMFNLQVQKSLIYNVNTDIGGNNELIARMERELKVSPIFRLNSNKIQQVEPSNIMEAVSKYSSERSAIDEATDIEVDTMLMNDADILSIISSLPKANSKNGIMTEAFKKDNITDVDTEEEASEEDAGNGGVPSGQPKPATDKDNPIDDFRKRFRTLYIRLLFYAFLTDTHVESLQDVLNSLSTEENKRIAANVQLDKRILLTINKHINKLILNELDFKISHINKLANDPKVDPLTRTITCIRKFDRISISEIITPEWIASDIVANIPKDGFKGKILDIASKVGEFTIALYERMKGLNIPHTDISERIYALPTSGISYEFTRKVFEALKLKKRNIITDFNAYDLVLSKDKDLYKNQLDNMRFSAVVGNPPYQRDNAGAGASASPIYNFFVDVAKEIEPEYISMIMPSRWFAGGRGVDDFRKVMLNDKRISHIHDFLNGRECFPNVEIKGGVMYFRWERDYEGDCTIITHNPDKSISQAKRPLLLKGMETFIRHNEAVSIVEKVKKNSGRTFDTIVSSRDPFGMDVRAEGTYIQVKPEFSLEKKSSTDIAYYYFGWRKDGVGYVSRDSIREGQQWIDKPKVFIPCVWGNGRIEEDRLKPFIPEQSSVCFETYLMVGPFASWMEAENAKKYMETKFFHVLVSPLKISHHATQSVYRLVPLQDFSEKSDINWSKPMSDIDRQLYKKYKLSDKEIDFIENIIKPVK